MFINKSINSIICILYMLYNCCDSELRTGLTITVVNNNALDVLCVYEVQDEQDFYGLNVTLNDCNIYSWYHGRKPDPIKQESYNLKLKFDKQNGRFSILNVEDNGLGNYRCHMEYNQTNKFIQTKKRKQFISQQKVNVYRDKQNILKISGVAVNEI
ncbi:uncharacterized protein LOC128960191 [Oppia nitens]|uniref:uncharacterized protein LOC128960191 n=1 Tax=Oppia nitens TaxID=1686743 RepID=UPI0023D9D124|nr:uncharacterized protein LOC128960191 [Oppia nitens]